MSVGCELSHSGAFVKRGGGKNKNKCGGFLQHAFSSQTAIKIDLHSLLVIQGKQTTCFWTYTAFVLLFSVLDLSESFVTKSSEVVH